MKIIVCVKPVPASADVTIDPVTKTVRRSSGENILSSMDKNALQLARDIKKAIPSEVTVLSMAPASSEVVIREALARGGDRAVILSDRQFAGGDTFATSYALSEAVKKLGGADLILTGAASDDGGTGQLSAQLAEWLGWRHLHNAVRVEAGEKEIGVCTLTDGRVCSWRSEYPLLVSTGRSINKTGPVGARDIIFSARKPIQVWSAEDLENLDRSRIGLDNSPTQNGELYPLDNGRAGHVIRGDAGELAAEILKQLTDAGISA